MNRSFFVLDLALRTGLAFIVMLAGATGSAQLRIQVPDPPLQGTIRSSVSTGNIQSCWTTPPPPKNGSTDPPHSVTLSWKAPTVRSTSKQDAVVGYYVYRRTNPSIDYQDRDALNSVLLPDTQCVDRAVTSGVYFYVVKAVAGNNLKSDRSNEARATIP
jgi:hypothetical protein